MRLLQLDHDEVVVVHGIRPKRRISLRNHGRPTGAVSTVRPSGGGVIDSHGPSS